MSASDTATYPTPTPSEPGASAAGGAAVGYADRVTNSPGSPRPGHLRRWGAAYLLVVLFAASWLGQLLAQLPAIADPAEHGWAEFWAATFENWQSEFLQLTVQAVVVVALARRFFAVSVDDHDRLEGKVDELLRRVDRASHRSGDDDR